MNLGDWFYLFLLLFRLVLNFDAMAKGFFFKFAELYTKTHSHTSFFPLNGKKGYFDSSLKTRVILFAPKVPYHQPLHLLKSNGIIKVLRGTGKSLE